MLKARAVQKQRKEEAREKSWRVYVGVGAASPVISPVSSAGAQEQKRLVSPYAVTALVFVQDRVLQSKSKSARGINLPSSNLATLGQNFLLFNQLRGYAAFSLE